MNRSGSDHAAGIHQGVEGVENPSIPLEDNCANFDDSMFCGTQTRGLEVKCNEWHGPKILEETPLYVTTDL